jgi:hypothetical protein
MGHLLFGLPDEYTRDAQEGYLNQSLISEPGEPNCAPDVDTAVKWWGDLSTRNNPYNYWMTDPLVYDATHVGFYWGCSYVKSNRRPTRNSIMNNHWAFELAHKVPIFGPVNDRYIRSILNRYLTPQDQGDQENQGEMT